MIRTNITKLVVLYFNTYFKVLVIPANLAFMTDYRAHRLLLMGGHKRSDFSTSDTFGIINVVKLFRRPVNCGSAILNHL